MQTLKTVVIVTVIALITTSSGPAFAGTVDKTELVRALIQVESGGNDHALGDTNKVKKAYGPLQVRQPCVDDVNRRYGTNIKAKDLLGDRATSVWVCQKYLEIFATQKRLGKEPTHEDMARIWNGGPNGWKSRSTITYWSKVKGQLSGAVIVKAKSPSKKLTLVAKK